MYKYGKSALTDPIALLLLIIRDLAAGRKLSREMKSDLMTLLIKLCLLVAFVAGVVNGL